MNAIPSGFGSMRLGRLASIRSSNVDKIIDSDEIPVRLCNYVDVYYNDRIDDHIDFQPGSALQREIDRFKLRAGDILLTKDSETPDDIAVAALVVEDFDDVICGYHLAILRPNRAIIDPTFLFWALRSKLVRESFSVRAQGITRYGLTLGGIGSVEIPFPDLATQKAIADFLDRETARIDQLIEKKQRLLQLLEEQWLSRVERAVVAGIEDSSELQWTRDDLTDPIPGHWRVTTLRRLATDIQTGPFGSQLHSHEYVEGGIPVINPSHMVRRRISPDRKIAVDKSTWQRLERHVVYEGDILVARRGELGRCALVTEREVGWLCGTGSLRLRLRKDLVIPEFLVYALSTRRVSEWLSLQSVGSTMDNLNTGILGRLSLPVPPVSEQRQIVALLNSVEQTTEQLTLRIHESIERLKESRSSLITAAVTGQLDIAAWSKRGETERQLETVEAAV